MADPITRAEYLAAFDTWFTVTKRDRDRAVWDAVVAATDLPGSGVPETFCERLRGPLWAADRYLANAIEKSGLLYRLVYMGEALRTVPCPKHKGTMCMDVWTGFTTCPHGCQGSGFLPGRITPLRVKMLLSAVPSGTISKEHHGPPGQEALYIGREPNMHGLNIVHLTEPAHQWPAVFALFRESPEIARAFIEVSDLLLQIHRSGLLAADEGLAQRVAQAVGESDAP